VTIATEHEAPQLRDQDGFSDAVTFSFGDPESELYGVARVGLSREDGAASASGLAVLFAGREPVAVRAAGGLEVSGDGWDGVAAAGVSTQVLEPLRVWSVAFASEDGAAGFELEFRAVSEPAELEAGSPAADAGGMVGYEQLCRVEGVVRARGGDRRISCLGQRGHSWGAPDWDRMALVRTVSAWMSEADGASLTAVRGVKAKEHADEALGAVLFRRAEDAAEGALTGVVGVVEPRLSTTYDSESRQRRATLELFEDDDSGAWRYGGEVRCGTTLDLGRLRLDTSFFVWHAGGRPGIGRYDVLRRA
jgi:hypothetical protein